jgi:hypothetical protein
VEARVDGGMKNRAFLKQGSLVIAAAVAVALFSTPRLAVKYFPERACATCHEMKAPVKRWREAGVAKNHPNCTDCHFEPGIQGAMELNKLLLVGLLKHPFRDPDMPIRPPAEPVIWEEGREPGYFSLVPNHRCFSCKDAPNHKGMDQRSIHSRLLVDVVSMPCRDCHNHDMRFGQRFYEKILYDTYD